MLERRFSFASLCYQFCCMFVRLGLPFKDTPSALKCFRQIA